MKKPHGKRRAIWKNNNTKILTSIKIIRQIIPVEYGKNILKHLKEDSM